MSNSNIFSIENANKYRCSVVSFTNSHNTLKLHVSDSNRQRQDIVIVFGRVSYFSGNLGWHGASFCFAKESEYITYGLQRKVQDLYKTLFIVENDNVLKTVIMAHFAYKIEAGKEYLPLFTEEPS